MPLRDVLFKSGLPADEFSRRKTLLASYYFLISILVRFFFGCVNIFNPSGATDLRMLVGGVIFSIACLILLRYGWVNTSILAHLIFSNVLAFMFTYPDPDQYLTGTYLFFIPTILWGLAIFGYEQRWMGIAFSGLSVLLFLIAIFDWEKFHFGNAHFFFISNFVIISVISFLILTYYNKEVHRSEMTLIQKNDELAKAHVELDRFVYSASHDLRAPISSLLGLIQLYKIGHQHEKDKVVELMETRVKKLDEFVLEIIHYSRNARQELQVTEFSPFELINSCWDRLRFIPQKVEIKFNNQTDPQLKVIHDVDRLRMLIENLISNGIKYAKSRPEPSFLVVNIFEAGNYLNIIVKDNGIGIAKEKQTKVFDMFYRAHENSDGSGLGLYIVKEMIQKMEGSFELESDVLKGTIFKIELPLTKQMGFLNQPDRNRNTNRALAEKQ